MTATLTSTPKNMPSQQPNVVLIVSDYMGYRDIGPYGADDIATPALDRLADQGTKFSDFYGAAPICSPSRAALLTGRYPERVGITGNVTADDGLSTAHQTLAGYLKGAGYATALFGKWHLGSRPEYRPNRHGFDEFLGFHAWTISYHSHRTESGEPGLYHNDTPLERAGYLTDILSEEAVGFIDRQAQGEAPFFLYLAYNTALPPYQPPGLPEHAWDSGWDVNQADRRDYVQMVEAMDSGIGRVLAALDQAGVSEQTLVIFAYDHGGRHLVRSEPLFHGFATLWEGGIRVPMLLRWPGHRWPGHVPPAETVSQPAISMDLTATILDAAGLDHLLPSLDGDGISLLPAVNGQVIAEERPLFWRLGRDKAVRQGRWKYLVEGVTGTQFLFDLEADIGERNNLFYRHPEVVAALRAALRTWERSFTADY